MTRENAIHPPSTQAKSWAASRAVLETALPPARIFALLAMTGMVATKGWQDHLLLGFALAGVAACAWAPTLREKGAARWWFFYVTGIFVYTLFRSLADETSLAPRTLYPIRLDEALALGHNPTRGLQRLFFNVTAPGWLDRFAVGLHWSFFVLPHAWALGIFLFDRHRFPRFVVAMLLTWYAGLALFFLVPTVPPWLASQDGALPGVVRIMDFVGRDAAEGVYASIQATFGEPNSVAAMPSLHIAITWLLVLFAAHRRRWMGGLLAIYCALMAAALLYLGEHYIVDMLAGATLASLCYLAAIRFTSSGSGGDPAIDGR